jgi:hypothetical protein
MRRMALATTLRDDALPLRLCGSKDVDGRHKAGHDGKDKVPSPPKRRGRLPGWQTPANE